MPALLILQLLPSDALSPIPEVQAWQQFSLLSIVQLRNKTCFSGILQSWSVTVFRFLPLASSRPDSISISSLKAAWRQKITSSCYAGWLSLFMDNRVEEKDWCLCCRISIHIGERQEHQLLLFVFSLKSRANGSHILISQYKIRIIILLKISAINFFKKLSKVMNVVFWTLSKSWVRLVLQNSTERGRMF